MAGAGAVGTMAKKILGNNALDIAGNVFNVAGGVAVYNESKKQGDSKAVSVGKAVADFAVGEFLGLWMIPFTVANVGAQVMGAMGQQNARDMGKMDRVGSGRVGSGSFDMTNAGYTMRQRAMNSMRNNAGSVLGNEARTFARSSAY